MTTRHRTRRQAFTILELILALALGALLLSALYVAINTHLGLTILGRKMVNQNAVAQVVVTKLTQDIASELAPSIPKQSSSSGGSSASSGTGSTTGGTTAGTTSGGTTSGAATGSSTATTTTSSAPGNNQASLYGATGNGAFMPLFNLGVQGDESTLTLFVSRFGKAGTAPVDTTDDTVEQPLRGDLRRVYYWCVPGGGQGGLYRQEVKVATSDQALTPASTPGPDADGVTLIAPEVRSLSFQYFDGNAWQDTWDGSQLGADGLTPIGPPLAVAVTVQIAPSEKGANADNPDQWKTYRHVVAIVTANGVGSNTAVTNNNSATATTTGN